MAVYFTGTSTGNRYEVGRQYEMNGSTYTANPDGSFTADRQRVVRDSTGAYVGVAERSGGGQTLVGSAGNPDVSWYASGGDSLRRDYYSPGSSVSHAGAEGAHSRSAFGSYVASGPSGGATRIAGPTQTARMYAGDTVRAAAWSGLDNWSGKKNAPQDTMVGGGHLMASPSTTNAEDFEVRYSDLGAAMVSPFIMGMDLGYTAAKMMGPEFFGPVKNGWSLETAGHRLNYIGAGIQSNASAIGSALVDATAMGAPSAIREEQPLRHNGWRSDDHVNWEYEGSGPAFLKDGGAAKVWWETTFPGSN